MGSFHGAQTSDPLHCQGLDNIMDRVIRHTHTQTDTHTLSPLPISAPYLVPLLQKFMSFNLMLRLQDLFFFQQQQKKQNPAVSCTPPIKTTQHQSQENYVCTEFLTEIHLYLKQAKQVHTDKHSQIFDT